MTPAVIARYAAPVPRYTSYPTAAQFAPGVDARGFAAALAALDPQAPVSLYTHVPFCHELCWYCGCTTKATRRRRPVAAYVATLLAEIDAVAGACPGRLTARHVHWGGGSPNSLAPDEIGALAAALRRAFDLPPTAEFAVEIDPRILSRDQIDAFARAGITRASIGVQDFDPTVQAAINRHQSYERTAEVVGSLRRAGIGGINVDLVYGLPHQTRASLTRTIERTLDLAPDRVALFGYAHMPGRFAHQRLIPDDALPDTIERFGQSRRARRLLEQAGYVAIGLDHFARAHDNLATGTVRRNFQGYTTDTATTLIGLGASAISTLPVGYFQNEIATAAYTRAVETASLATAGLATARGVILSDDDRLRGHVIEHLMCAFAFSRRDVEARFGAAAAAGVVETADLLLGADTDGLVAATDDGFRVTAIGRPFVRAIASCFDAYLDGGAGRFSAGI
jgi:oxygen-independent coproporphyrinogen-3 oxidase